MRNIRGGFLNTTDPRFNFAEVFPDEGDLDLVAIMRILRDSEFSHAILPDHMPSHPDDPGKLQAFAFGYGYIQALIQSVNAEVYGTQEIPAGWSQRPRAHEELRTAPARDHRRAEMKAGSAAANSRRQMVIASRFNRRVNAVAIALILTTMLASAQERQAPPPAPVPAVLQNYSLVTAERLLKPADGDWLMIRRTYDGWGYSPLDQITTANVAKLQPEWVFATGVSSGHEAPPIVNGGVMFVATPGNQVIALDARTGVILWRYRRPMTQDVVQPHPTSRGVALFGDRVFFAAAEAVLVALDARTGKEVWTTKVAENKSAYYMSLAPLVADGKVMIGTSGGGHSRIRCRLRRRDSGSRRVTVPAPGGPAAKRPAGGDQWKTGGGSIKVTEPRSETHLPIGARYVTVERPAFRRQHTLVHHCHRRQHR